jgi:hypothetical protein
MDIKILRPRTRTLCFLPRRATARVDLGAAEGAQTGGEVGPIVEGLVAAVATGGGGGTTRHEADMLQACQHSQTPCPSYS